MRPFAGKDKRAAAPAGQFQTNGTGEPTWAGKWGGEIPCLLGKLVCSLPPAFAPRPKA